MITFLDKLFILSISIVSPFNFLFGFSIIAIEVVVESKELDDAGDVDDRNKHP